MEIIEQVFAILEIVFVFGAIVWMGFEIDKPTTKTHKKNGRKKVSKMD